MNSTTILGQKWFIDECFKWLPLNWKAPSEEIKTTIDSLMQIESPEAIINKITKWEYPLNWIKRKFNESLWYLILNFNISTPLWDKPLEVIFYEHINHKFSIMVNKTLVELNFIDNQDFLNIINWIYTIPSYASDWEFSSKMILE